MDTRRPLASAASTDAVAGALHGHGPSSLLRMGSGTEPRRLAPAVRLLAARPFFLGQRTPSLQLNLFGPAPAAR